MSDNFHEQVSEFSDDEMSVEESEFFVRRLQRDDSARQRYLRYQLIGAGVRGEYLHPGASDLGQRFEHARNRDEAVAIQSNQPLVRLASGTGIAASIALVTLFALAMLGSESLVPGGGLDSTGQGAPALAITGASVESALFARAPDQVTGIQYMMHHARYSSGMVRTIMQSNVVAAEEASLADDFEELTIE